MRTLDSHVDGGLQTSNMPRSFNVSMKFQCFTFGDKLPQTRVPTQSRAGGLGTLPQIDTSPQTAGISRYWSKVGPSMPTPPASLSSTICLSCSASMSPRLNISIPYE